MLHVLKRLVFKVFSGLAGAKLALQRAMTSESYPETVAVDGGGQQPDEKLRAALQAALPHCTVGKVIGTGGISTCFEAFASGQPRAIKVSHKGVSPRGSNHLIAILAEVNLL